MTMYYNDTLPEMVGPYGQHVLTVSEQISTISPQYMGHIMRASIILLSYALYNFYIMMPRIEERTWKNIVFFHFNTVALVMSMFLFVISLIYQGWIDL